MDPGREEAVELGPVRLLQEGECPDVVPAAPLEWVICAPASQPRVADPGIWNIGREQQPFQCPPSPVILSPGACQNQLKALKY